MARAKNIIANNIRNRIVSPHRHEHGDIANTVDLNFASINSVSKLGDIIDKFTSYESSALAKLTKELHVIPLSLQQLNNHQDRLFNNLIRMVALLEIRAAKETDPAKKAEIESSIGELKERGGKIEDRLRERRGGQQARNWKDVAAIQMGLSTKEVEQKGLLKTLFSRSKRILSFKEQNRETHPLSENFSELVGKYKEIYTGRESADAEKSNKASIASSVEKDSLSSDYTKESVKGKTRKNSESISIEMNEMNSSLYAILDELSSIRKTIQNKQTSGGNNENADLDTFISGTKAPSLSGIRNTDEDLTNENVDRATGLSPVSGVGGSRDISSGLDSADTASTGTAPATSPSGPSGPSPVPSGILGGLGVAAIGYVKKKLAARAADKAAKAAAAKATTKLAKNAAAKGAAKLVAKGALKSLPLIGLALGAKFAYDRMKSGDAVGAMGELASGIASTVPGAGTAASLAIDAGMVARDVSKASSKQKNAGAVMAEMTDKKEQGNSVVAPITNVTNNYAQENSGNNVSTFIPSIRNAEASFLRYLDKRMTRIL